VLGLAFAACFSVDNNCPHLPSPFSFPPPGWFFFPYFLWVFCGVFRFSFLTHLGLFLSWSKFSCFPFPFFFYPASLILRASPSTQQPIMIHLLHFFRLVQQAYLPIFSSKLPHTVKFFDECFLFVPLVYTVPRLSFLFILVGINL